MDAAESVLERKVLAAAIVLSLLVHLWALHAFSIPEPAAPDPDDPDYVEVTKLDPAMLAELTPDKPEKKVIGKPRGQIVDLGKPAPGDPDSPANFKYLSERNMRTKKETVKISKARTGSPANPPRPKPPRIAPPPEPRRPPPPKPLPKPRPKPPEEKAAPEPPDKDRAETGSDRRKASPPEKDRGASTPARDKADVPETPPAPKEKRTVPIEVARADNTDERGANDFRRDNFKVDMADLRDVLEADDGSIDHLPDVARGDITSLNAKSYTYASFYNRIKKIIRFNWRPQPALDSVKWRGNRLETRIRVVILADGTLGDVEVVSSSGFPGVDAAAVRALRKSAPFYNVPEGLLDAGGRLDDVWAFFINPEH